jgi:hypothetical protein
MAAMILSQLAEDINHHINSHEELETKLLQADALARMGESIDFDQFSKSVIRHYLVTLMELIEEATQLSGNLSQALCQWASKLKQQPNST